MTTAPLRTAEPRQPRSRPKRQTRTTAGLFQPGADGGFRTLGRIADPGAPTRELITRHGAAGSLLLIDRDAALQGDERLIAHLAADEPKANAALMCRLYAETPPDGRRCRALTEEDARFEPLDEHLLAPAREKAFDSGILETDLASFHLARLPSRMSIPELRWTRRQPSAIEGITVSLRECIATVEDYEPLRSITRAAVARHVGDESVSTTTLRAELQRVLESPIVLNRGVREAVLERVARDGSSLSEIAIRCGRVKSDSRGNQSGETSWLARRIGLLPEGGQSVPTVWVHSDVLGLIAREGLGISPREVELG
jgi:hypothetical protein